MTFEFSGWWSFVFKVTRQIWGWGDTLVSWDYHQHGRKGLHVCKIGHVQSVEVIANCIHFISHLYYLIKSNLFVGAQFSSFPHCWVSSSFWGVRCQVVQTSCKHDLGWRNLDGYENTARLQLTCFKNMSNVHPTSYWYNENVATWLVAIWAMFKTFYCPFVLDGRKLNPLDGRKINPLFVSPQHLGPHHSIYQ